MTHIMLDLETWGTEPGCDIRSIGACVFVPSTGVVGDRNPPLPLDFEPMSFYVAVDNPRIDTYRTEIRPGEFIDTAHHGERYKYKYPLTRDPETVAWWNDQSAEAQAAFVNPVDLREGLLLFTEWLDKLAATYNPGIPPMQRLWCHGPSFDIPILAAAYKACGLPVPWHYRAPRDTRTIMEAAGMDPHKGLEPFNTGTHHHSLDDAITQAKAVCEAYRRLRAPQDWSDDEVRDMFELEERLTNGVFYTDYDADWRRIGTLRNLIAGKALPLPRSSNATICPHGICRTDATTGKLTCAQCGATFDKAEQPPATIAAHGWVAYGPDGEWHWSEKRDTHESITEQRPATALEKCLMNNIGNTTEYFAPTKTNTFHIAWNEARNEGFVTDDLSDAMSAVHGRAISSLAREFHEIYGDDDCTVQEVQL